MWPGSRSNTGLRCIYMYELNQSAPPKRYSASRLNRVTRAINVGQSAKQNKTRCAIVNTLTTSKVVELAIKRSRIGFPAAAPLRSRDRELYLPPTCIEIQCTQLKIQAARTGISPIIMDKLLRCVPLSPSCIIKLWYWPKGDGARMGR